MDPFAALADPVRRDLLVRLSRGTARVVDLAAEHAISRPAISRHLRLLAEAGLVAADERGRERHYGLTSSGLEPVTDLLETLLGAAAPAPPIADHQFDGLDLEVRRTVRERRTPPPHPAPQEDTA